MRFTSCFVESSLAPSISELLFFQPILFFCFKGLDEISWQLGTTTLRACSSKLYRCRLFASRLRRLRPLIFELLLPPRRYISSSAAAATTTTITVCR